MKSIFCLILGSLLLACGSPPRDISENKMSEKPNFEAISIKEIDSKNQIEENPNVLLQIPEKFRLVKKDESKNKNDTLVENYWTYNNYSFEAKLYTSKSEENFIAINNVLEVKNCKEFKNFLLKKDENGVWQNVFEDYYPNLSIYTFYSFGDKEVAQFEGDEKTIFAGYRFHFDKVDSLGIQFMFCNLNSIEDTKKLNKNARIIYNANLD